MALKFRKCGDVHAITEFIAMVRFASSLDALSFAKVADKADGLAAKMDLPAKLASPTFAFSLGPTSLPPQIGNIGYQRFSGDGEPAERMVANQNSITYSTRSYKGWEKTLPLLQEIFGELSLEYLKAAPLLAGLQVQYLNEFNGVDPGWVSPEEVIRADSKWVAPIYRESVDLWHSHVGQFIRDESSRQLVNVDVDCLVVSTPRRPDEFTQLKASIVAARAYDVEPNQPLAVSPVDIRDCLATELTKAHDLERNVLETTLSDEYLKDVGAC